MHLLYADESGSAVDKDQNHFVMAGFSISEKQGYWISRQLDGIAARFEPVDPMSVELHGSPMLQGRRFWRRFPVSERVRAIQDGLQVLSGSGPSARAFAVAIRKSEVVPEDPVSLAFEYLTNRFDLYLLRLHRAGRTQRGIIILDKMIVEGTLQNLANDFRTVGHRWGIIRNLAEVPLFLNSRASRLIQLADLIAFATFRYYERGDRRFMEIIRPRLDAEGGVVHGLVYRH